MSDVIIDYSITSKLVHNHRLTLLPFVTYSVEKQ
ncbi:MAG: hypothetical protein A4E53_02153 [Pelotomaculum sp. PtaB.Bin104]|nr:MAG: hypothetical protein A4E53_02153 [Pelotomaculum sp. PtaB.Bin104]